MRTTKTKPFTPEQEDTFDTDLYSHTIDLGTKKHFEPWTWDEIEATSDLAWLIGNSDNPVLLAAALWIIYGLYKSGKTYLAFEMAFCVAFGISFNGLPTAHGNIVYLIAEGGVRRMRARFEALYEKYKPEMVKRGFLTAKRAFDSGHFSMIPNAVNLVDFNEANGADKLLEQIPQDRKYVAVFLDTWALMMAASGGSDTDDKTVMPSIGGLKHIQNTLGCTVAIVAHVGYAQTAQERPKGLSDLPAAMDGGVLSQKTVKNGTEIFTFTSVIQRHAANGSTLTATLKKQGPNLALDFMDREAVKENKLSSDEKTALGLVVDLPMEKRSVNTWRDRAEQIGMFAKTREAKNPQKAWNNAWYKIKKALTVAGYIRVQGDVVTVVDKATEEAQADFE